MTLTESLEGLAREDRLAYLSRAQELLRLDHNAKGADYRNAKITESAWQRYVSQFKVISDKIASQLSRYEQEACEAHRLTTGLSKRDYHRQIDADGILLKPLRTATTYDRDINLGAL